LWQSLCSRTPFQQYVENDRQLHQLPFWMQTVGLTPDSLQTKTNGYRTGPGPDSRVDGTKLYSHSSEYSPDTDKLYGVLRCCAVGWSLSSSNNKAWTNCILQHLKRQFPWPKRLRALLPASFS
jgi:hypothetical protein